MAQTLQARLAAQAAAAADATTILGVASEVGGSDAQVQRVSVISPSAVNGQATNNVTLSVRVSRGGSVVATVATLTLAAGTNLAAGQPTAMVVTPGTALQRGDVLDVLAHQNGTGLALPAGVVIDVETHFQPRG